MALKTIKYTITGNGVTPITEQAGGMQGEHNVTEVEMTLGTGVPMGDDVRYRVQTIDGAGGFYSTEFLTPSDGKITFLLSRHITLAGGVAYLYLVATKVIYEGEKFVSESQEFLSKAMRLRFENSGVGSPSENAYRLGVTGALLKANDLATEASKSANEAKAEKELAKAEAESSRSSANESKNHENNANTYATNAQTFANEAKTNKEFAEGAANDAQNSANTAQADAQTALDAVGEVTKIKQQVTTLKSEIDTTAETIDATASRVQSDAFTVGENTATVLSETEWVRANIGDMGNALKEIIALQKKYIGGNN